jgi:hypothetical protein
VSEIYRILKPHGYAVVSTENLSSMDNIFALLLGYAPFSMDYDGIKIANPFSSCEKSSIRLPRIYSTHIHIFTYKALSDFFKYFGFEIEKVVGAGSIFPLLSMIDSKHARFITIKARKRKSLGKGNGT